ncbi:MAG: hypothetical protein GWP10_13455 [Nitrospiraceae bacterium]|nr:hypothetical protein [Nitrospiraceae bacterium]
MEYDIYVGYEFEIEGSIASLIEKTRSLTDYKQDYPCDYHDSVTNTKRGRWRVEKDASLHDGAEFISPPQKLEESLVTMRSFLKLVRENGSITTERCGCHTNMSLVGRGKILKINENALLSNINWRFLYSLWGNRLRSNDYCKNMSTIFNSYKQRANNIKMLNLKDIILAKNHNFITKKSSLTLKKGAYYELRFPGGVNYSSHPDKIEKTVRYFGNLLIESRQTINKRRYNKKIISYINRVYKGYNNKSKLIDIESLSKTKADIITNNKVLKTLNYIKYTDRDRAKLRKMISKDMIYYFIKYVYFNIDMRSTINTLRSLERFKTFSIPKSENDTNKLWLTNIYEQLSSIEKNTIIKSIKNKKVLKIFNKMITNINYRQKILLKKYE